MPVRSRVGAVRAVHQFDSARKARTPTVPAQGLRPGLEVACAHSRCCSIEHQSHCGALNVPPFVGPDVGPCRRKPWSNVSKPHREVSMIPASAVQPESRTMPPSSTTTGVSGIFQGPNASSMIGAGGHRSSDGRSYRGLRRHRMQQSCPRRFRCPARRWAQSNERTFARLKIANRKVDCLATAESARKNHGNVRPAEYSKPSVCAPQAK